MLPLAKAFQARGDDVVWLTAAGGCDRLRREGIDAAEAGIEEADGIAEFHQRFPEGRDIPAHELPDFMFPRLFVTVRARRMLDDALPIAQAWTPDILICDAAELTGPLIAASLGVPNVTHSFGALLPASRVASASDLTAPMWVEQGLEPRPFCGCYDHLYLDIYPPSLQRADFTHVGMTQLVRPEGMATGAEPLPDFVTAEAAAPLLYVTLGTVFSSETVLATVVKALADLSVRAVVTVGPRGDPAALGSQPDNVFVARYIAQQDLLPHCTAVISHGGSGTFLAALAAGLPQLCLPQAADQFLNASAAEASGCALALRPPDLSPDAVTQSVTRILDEPAFRESAQRLGDEIASMPDATVVAERIATLVP
jgi:UDP:flavonoid glycosyltransferase YjiC (YdhE family)